MSTRQTKKRMGLGLVLAAGMMMVQSGLAAGPAPVNLLSTARFTILSGAAITTTGGGIITGDVGASPIAGSAIHLTDAQVSGTIYAVDNTGPSGSVMDPVMLTAAKNDLTTAYNDAAGRTPVPTGPFLNPGGGNIGGLNLVPGLYKFTSEAHIEGSDVTLTGGPDDVWIFQIAAALIMGADGRKVILAGGAQAKNVFWQVGTSATIGTFGIFKGTILADQSITLDTSSTMEGRALAFSGGVTFNGTGGTRPTSSQVITNFIPTNGTVMVAAAKVGLSAQASSGLPVSFTVGSGPGVITGGTNLAFASTGLVRIVASQAGNTFYSPASNVTHTYTVTPPLSAEPGWLEVQVTPAGGNWQLTAPAGYSNATAGTGSLAAVHAVVGEYSIAYGALSGYVTPTQQTQFVVAGETSVFSGVYLQIASNLAAPVVSATQGIYTNKVRVSWPSVPGVIGYEIWKSATNDVTTAVRLVAVPDYGAATFQHDDYDVVPDLSYYYWGLSKTATQASPLSAVAMGYASLVPSPVGTADITASDMVYLPVNVTNLTTAGTVSCWLGNLGPDPLDSTDVAFDFHMGNAENMVLLGSIQRTFSLVAGQEQLVILTPEEKLGLVVPAGMSGVQQVQVTVAARTLNDPNLANNTTTGPGTVLVRASGVNSPGRSINDYDGDGKSDLALALNNKSLWWALLSGTRNRKITGISMNTDGGRYWTTAGDYDGDGLLDFGLYEEHSGTWSILKSSDGLIMSGVAGGPGFRPISADYDGDQKTDPALYAPELAYWIVYNSSANYAPAEAFGVGGRGYEPVTKADYDGDGLADPMTYLESTGNWMGLLSAQNYVPFSMFLGGPGIKAGAADFDGDGLADPTLYQEANGLWLVQQSTQNYQATVFMLGGPGYTAVPGDFDGDGRADPAVYNEMDGMWFGWLSGHGYRSFIISFGGENYHPISELIDE